MAQADAARNIDAFGAGQVISHCQPLLSKLLKQRGQDLDGMRAQVLSDGVVAKVIRFTGPDWDLVAKAFNPANPDARTLLDREVRILESLADWPLTPNLVARPGTDLVLITEAVAGQTLDKIATNDNVLAVAQHIGAWYSIFSRSLPRIAQTGATRDWGSYLARYGDLFSTEELNRNHAMLSALKIDHRGMAKNDAVLTNFLRAENGNLVGLDFAAAAMKPVGWDLLLTGRILAQSFPDRTQGIAEALARGWRQDIDGNPQADFAKLIAFFAETTADRTPTFVNGPTQKYRETYNAAAQADPNLPQAEHVFRFFTHSKDLEPVAQVSKDDLRAALMIEAENAVATPQEAHDPEQTVDTFDPSPTLVSACALCVGGCCRRGQQSHAFLRAGTLNRMVQRNPAITAAEIVDHYIALVPDVHVAGSCLYHGEAGCVLPRDVRSNTCNSYVCRFGRIIENSKEKLAANPGPVLLVGTDDGRAKVAEIHDGHRVMPVDPSMLDGEG